MAAPGQMGTPNNAAASIDQNNQLRQLFKASAPRMLKKLGAFTAPTNAAQGSTTRVKLFNVGVTTKLLLEVTGTYDVGTAVVTASPKAPFSMINRIKLTDYDGTDRVNCSGYQLWVVNSLRNGGPYGYNNESQTNVLTNPVLPLTVGTNQPYSWIIEVPIAFNPDNADFRGAMLTQTAVGEAYLSIDWANAWLSNGNDDSVFNGGATSTLANVNATVTVFQEYYMPQQVGNQVPLPVLDLATVYELAGAVRSSDNIASGTEKLFNFPNLRSVIGFYANFLNNSVMNAGSDVATFRMIANGNNVLREYDSPMKLFSQRQYITGVGFDLRKGTYFERDVAKPIETALFGNVQFGITPTGTVTGTCNFELMFESFYVKGSRLPGLAQSSG